MQKGSTRLGWPVDDILPLFHATKMFALNHFFYDKNHFFEHILLAGGKYLCPLLLRSISMMNQDTLQLLKQYDLPTPRYTSYPTVPYWDFNSIDENAWKESVIKTFIAEKGEICLYIHLPFCENLCTFCACNKRITVNHAVELPYLVALFKEWKIYRSLFPFQPTIKEIHLGGGTPTFFSPQNLLSLIKGITRDALIAPDHEFSIEVHPNFSTEEHLKELAAIGFNRISLGVQDFDPKVQFAINRMQSFEKTKEVVDWARKHNYQSINIDLIYGLPFQTVESVELSMQSIQSLMPDRIAFYSYAHVPWKSKVQRRYNDHDLPRAEEKWKMYQRGKELLEKEGFKSIGMDHFALPNDKMMLAAATGKLHRNFMGYTTTNSKLLIGLGASSISDSWNAFVQNEKTVEDYQSRVMGGSLPIMTGHLLTKEDELIRSLILDLICKGSTTLPKDQLSADYIERALQQLALLQKNELLTIEGNLILVTQKGASFIRNICACLDAKLMEKGSVVNTFSKAI
jgi:oxygen-independent coproporphyrinogen-3 oxidase